MNIIKKHNQLVLERKKLHGFVSQMFFGLVFSLVGLAIMSVSTIDKTLKCERLEPTQVSCKLLSASIVFGNDEKHIQFLHGASMDVSHSEDGDTYRVILHTDAGDVPLTESYDSSRTQKQQNIDKIERFLINDGAGTQNNMQVEQKGSWVLLIIGGLFAFVGASVATSAVLYKKPSTIIFDNVTRKMGVEYKNALKMTQVEEHPLADVIKSYVKEETDDDKTTYNIVIQLKNTTISLGSFENNNAIVKSINHFLSQWR